MLPLKSHRKLHTRTSALRRVLTRKRKKSQKMNSRGEDAQETGREGGDEADEDVVTTTSASENLAEPRLGKEYSVHGYFYSTESAPDLASKDKC